MVRIEPFQAAHLEGVVALCAAEGWDSWTRDKVGRAFAAAGVIAVVALDGDEVVGLAELLSDGQVMAYLALLVVAPKSRGTGVGQALVADLFERSGLSRIDLLSTEAAGSFYDAFPHKRKPGYRIYLPPRG
jgi:predicted N-acetyltransferase YhbS